MKTSLEPVTIAGIAAFQNLDSIQRSILASQLTKKIYRKGEAITNYSADEMDVFFILSGKVRTCAVSAKGKEIQFEDLGPGQMFGELAALDGQGRTSDCISMTESSLAVMSKTDFLAALESYSEFNRYVMMRLTTMLRKHIGRVVEFSVLSAKDRIRIELYRLAMQQGNPSDSDIKIHSTPTHSDIAARISSHREAVTRELKRLESLGVITWRPGEYVIHDLHALTTSLG